MMAKTSYSLSAKTWEYKKDNETKSNYQQIWSMFEKEDGKMVIKLDTLPISKEWDGWIYVNKNMTKEERAAKKALDGVEDPF